MSGLAIVLVNLLVAPCVEETVARWGLQDGLLERMAAMGSRERALLSSGCVASLFAACHVLLREDVLSAATWFPAFVIGILYSRKRALAPCVLLHAAFNLVWFAAIAPLGLSFSN